jgi:hypothetical protein
VHESLVGAETDISAIVVWRPAEAIGGLVIGLILLGIKKYGVF